jgi:glycerol-3-phosphate cytidylyltransferase
MKIGFTCGAFDLLHAGHVLMLIEAREQCDWLIVGLHTDPTIDRPTKNKPIQSVLERYIQLKALKVVDEIIPYDTEKDLLAILNNFNVNVRIIGEDYIGKDFTGKDLPIETYFNKRKHSFSSTELRNRISHANQVEGQLRLAEQFNPPDYTKSTFSNIIDARGRGSLEDAYQRKF